MSSEATPISAARFAEALRDLDLSTLHLKAMELRNSIAHLDYSNEQLQPFATGTDPSTHGIPDPDCLDAIKENEAVIARQTERIALLKAEVENRGGSWTEFQRAQELKGTESESGGTGVIGEVNGAEGERATINEEQRSSAWTDGTFQTGRIVAGEVRMDEVASGSTNGTGAGGRLDDEALRRAMEERMRALQEGSDDEGMHL